jgi:glutathione S-transferase
MTELLGLPYSPWSEKARWALDARRVPYRDVLYAPLVGEPALRLKLRKWSGVVTVPVLTTDDGRVLGDSGDIARWADERGEGDALFPRGKEAEIAAFVALSERGLAAGRGISLARMLGDDEALAEMVPKPLRKLLGKTGARIGAAGIRRTMRKYRVAGTEHEALVREACAVLDELRETLARVPDGRPKTLLAGFTFADIAMAQVLAFVQPPKTGLRLGKGSRRAFTDPSLREQYDDLVAWRDALYDAYRARRERGAAH